MIGRKWCSVTYMHLPSGSAVVQSSVGLLVGRDWWRTHAAGQPALCECHSADLLQKCCVRSTEYHTIRLRCRPPPTYSTTNMLWPTLVMHHFISHPFSLDRVFNVVVLLSTITVIVRLYLKHASVMHCNNLWTYITHYNTFWTYVTYYSKL